MSTEAVNFLIKYFPPAKEWKDAESVYSTAQLSKFILDETGVRVKRPDLNEILTGLKYVQHRCDDIFMWLIAEVKDIKKLSASD